MALKTLNLALMGTSVESTSNPARILYIAGRLLADFELIFADLRLWRLQPFWEARGGSWLSPHTDFLNVVLGEQKSI
jgi:hypothetical protein